MTIESDIEVLAAHVAKEASSSKSRDVPFSEKVDALKALTQYYAARAKLHKGNSDDEDGANFATFAKELEKTNGEPEVGSDRIFRRLPPPGGDS